MSEENMENMELVSFEGFKLSDLLISETSYNRVYGVNVDEESFTPPDGLNEIGFIYKVDDSGDIDEILLDVIISYGLSDVKVILEIPFETSVKDIPYLMSVASNAGFSLSILPPCEITEDSRVAYILRLSEFVDAFLNQKNFTKFIYPVSSYLEYMYIEVFSDVSDFKPTDDYILNRYVENTTEEFSDAFKAVIREKIFTHFGGEVEFRNFTKAVFSKIYEQTERNCVDILETQFKKTDDSGEMPESE